MSKIALKSRRTPALDRARLGIDKLLGEGLVVLHPEQLARTAEISEATARAFLASAETVGLVNSLKLIIPVAKSGLYLVTERYPRAPSRNTIISTALLWMASGYGGSHPSPAAFAYHTALAMLGLTEVAPMRTLHLIKVRPSIRKPTYQEEYRPSDREPTTWTQLQDRTQILLTLRGSNQISAADITTVQQEDFSLAVTTPIRTLVDAWMHPTWCGGPDRVADSWRMYWEQLSGDQRGAAGADLVALLVETGWPGLWHPLDRWLAGIIPGLSGLAAKADKLAARRLASVQERASGDRGDPPE